MHVSRNFSTCILSLLYLLLLLLFAMITQVQITLIKCIIRASTALQLNKKTLATKPTVTARSGDNGSSHFPPYW